MRATIEKVSKYGVMINGDWKNLSKFHKQVSLSGISAGDEVEIELQKDKFITSLTLVSVNGENGNGETKTVGTQVVNREGKNPTKDEAKQRIITALSVLSTVFEGTYNKKLETMDHSQALEETLVLADSLVEWATKKGE